MNIRKSYINYMVACSLQQPVHDSLPHPWRLKRLRQNNIYVLIIELAKDSEKSARNFLVCIPASDIFHIIGRIKGCRLVRRDHADFFAFGNRLCGEFQNPFDHRLLVSLYNRKSGSGCVMPVHHSGSFRSYIPCVPVQDRRINKDFSENWERIGKINGRIPFNVAAAIGALLITSIDDYYYDTEKKILTEESDGSKRFIPIKDESGFVETLVGMYSDLIGLKDATLEKLLEDEYRPGWEDYAENFLDEITDSWADGCNFIVENYADSDISKMMDVFGEKE